MVSVVMIVRNGGLKAGFSLIEIAIVIVIYGGITAMAVTLGMQWSKSQRVVSSEQTLETITMALGTYAKLNGRLPCPGDRAAMPGDAAYGLEAHESGDTLGDCISGGSIMADGTAGGYALGSVPARTLNLPESMMRDEWGGLITYLITQDATREGAFWSQPEHANYLSPDSGVGDVIVRDGSGAVRTGNALFALVSHGPNQHGALHANGTPRVGDAPSTAELENCDCLANGTHDAFDAVIVDQSFSNDFDDVILFRTRGQFLRD